MLTDAAAATPSTVSAGGNLPDPDGRTHTSPAASRCPAWRAPDVASEPEVERSLGPGRDLSPQSPIRPILARLARSGSPPDVDLKGSSRSHAPPRQEPRLLLIASPGGHLSQLHALDRFWRKYQRTWVTSRSLHSDFLLQNENVVEACFPTNRSLVNFFRNLHLAVKVLGSARFDMVVSTGAGVAVPFFLIARLFRVNALYIETVSRHHSLSLSGMLVYYLASEFLVQWPDLSTKFRRAKFRGSVL